MTTSENLNRIIQAKSDIKQAIENKGVNVGDITIDGYADKIKDIPQTGKWIMPQGTSFNFSQFLEFDGTHIDVSGIDNMDNMFDSCYKVTSIDLSTWDLSNVTSMNKMFNSCGSLRTLIMGGDVSNVETVGDMFTSASSSGTFYYNRKYNYSKIIAALPSGWMTIPTNFD